MTRKRELPRLTATRVKEACRGLTKAEGWCKLMKRGYFAEEIAAWTEATYPADVNTRVRLYCDRHDLPWPATAGRRREVKQRRPHILDYRGAFKQKVMRTGLELRLSQTMLEYLCAVAADVQPDWGTRAASSSLVTSAALEARGLIRSVHEKRGRMSLEQPPWELTPIGVALVALLKEAGVFHESDNALEKRLG